MTTTVTGGAAGAKVTVTPLVAVSVAVDSTTADLGTGTGVSLDGAYTSTATQTGAVTTKATGTTQGNSVAVGASLALTTAIDTVSASVNRNLTTTGSDNGITVAAVSTSSSTTSATASVAGGAAEGSDGKSSSGQDVDTQVKTQGDKAKASGADAAATSKTTGSTTETPSASTSDGKVTVAAAIGVNVGVASTKAEVGSGATLTSAGKLTVASSAQTGAQATADGSQTGNTAVGVGAAVALNVGTTSNQALIDDGSTISAKGVTVSALMPTTGTTSNAFGASATSGAGASNVGVAGSLAANVVVNTTEARLDGTTIGTSVAAGGGDVAVETSNTSTSTVSAGAKVTGSGSDAKVGVGASVGLNVVVDSSVAEVGDGVALTGVDNLTLSARSDNTLITQVTGGASGAKVNITPLAAVAVALNTTSANLGTSATDLDLAGNLSTQATGTDTVTTTATGQTSGDVAVGASLAATVAMDHVSAGIERNAGGSTGIDLEAGSTTSLTTTATASAKGAATQKDPNDSSKPAAGTTPDEQKDAQLNFAQKQNSGTKNLDLSKENDSTSATTPSTNTDSTGNTKQSGAKVSVAAAIGVGVAENQAVATTGTGVKLSTSGDLAIKATTDTNYATKATGEAVSDKDGIAAAVALTATLNETQAALGANNTVSQAGSITIAAKSEQNLDQPFLKGQASVAVSGASGGEVAVAGALAVVANSNETLADIGEGAEIGTGGTPVGDISVTSNDTSRLSASAMAGAASNGSESKAGVGASFAVLLAENKTTAGVGYGTLGTASDIDADSLTVLANKNPIQFTAPFNIVTSPKDKDFLETLANPATYLSQVNDYTEAVAGAESKGDAAVAGSFAVNVFGNTTNAYVNNASVTTTGTQSGGTLGVQVASHADTDAISVAGAVAASKQAGVGISNTDIVNSDQVLASVEGTSKLDSTHSVQVDANAKQNIVNVSISAAAATSGTGVGGVLGVIVTMNDVEASIGQGASVQSEGDVAVTAGNATLSVMAAGGIGAGDSVGVGASVAANIIKNKTLASIGQDAKVDAAQTLTVGATASETAVTGVVAGAASEQVSVSGSLSLDTILTDTEASIGQGAQVNTVYSGPAQAVAITAQDTSTVVGLAGSLAAAGDVGVGASIDTAVLDKKVMAFIADDADGKDAAVVDAKQQVAVNATSTDSIVSVTAGLAGGGDVAVGGAVSIGVVENSVQASIGQHAKVHSDGNVLVNAEDDITAVLTAGGAAFGGDAGMGASLAVATLLGSTKATIGADAEVTALGNGSQAQVYTGTGSGSNTAAARGLAVTANTQDNLMTTDVSGAGSSDVGLAFSLSGNVIATDTEATIAGGAIINKDQTGASSAQQVQVKANDDTILYNTAGSLGGAGAVGIGGSANVGVVSKTTIAQIGVGAQVKATKAVELDANSTEFTTSTTAGFGFGGTVGVAGSAGAIAVADTTEAIIADGTSTTGATTIAVSGGDLALSASDKATSILITGAGAGGGTTGVGISLAVAVNTSKTQAKIGDYAVTDATGETSVLANSYENLDLATVAGSGGGAAGVAGTIAVNVVASDTEAGIGKNAKVNLGGSPSDQTVDVEAKDEIITASVGGVGTGGGAAGVGGTADVTFAKNTTTAYIDNDAQVNAGSNVTVNASDTKYVNSAIAAGAGGGAAGVDGTLSVIAVGSLLDDQANSGLQVDSNGNNKTTTAVDASTDTSTLNKSLGSSAQSTDTANQLSAAEKKASVSDQIGGTTSIPHTNTQAYIGKNAKVNAGGDVKLTASDTTMAIVAAGSGAGGGAAGVAGAFGVVLLHDSAEAFIADGAQVNAKGEIGVNATTGEQVYNMAVTATGAGAADVGGAAAVNVVTSDTAAYVGAAKLNQDTAYQQGSESVSVNAGSSTVLVTAAGAGGGSGAASVGGVLNTNVLVKNTEAYIGDGAAVSAQTNVGVSAASTEDIVNGAVSIRGAGAAAVSGVVEANLVDDTTQAYIGASRKDTPVNGAVVDSQGNVTLSATDATLIVAASAVGNGAGAAAVGGNVAANVIANDTEAYVSDKSTVNARGKAGGVSVYDGGVGAASDLPAVPGGQSGQLDISGSGSSDANLSQGASFNLTDSDGNTRNTSDGMSGQTPTAAAGGLQAMTTSSGVKGLSISAVSEEKEIPVTLSVAGAGAAAVTGSAAANIVITTTKATIGDGVKVNTSAGPAAAVQLTAADNTLLVQTAGTISGAGAAAVSGAGNVGVVAKTTQAGIGDSTVNASDLSVHAVSAETVYSIGANLSVAGAAGVGGSVGVDAIENQTTASIGAGATINATGDLDVKADQDSAINLYTFSGAGGIVGVSGALSAGIIDNTTEAFVASSASKPTTLNAAGTTDVAATSTEAIQTVTVSGAGGGVGIAGAVAVKIVTSTTEAYIDQDAEVNQTTSAPGQNVKVSANDTVDLTGGGGTVSYAGLVGVGATAEINIVRNTTAAYLGAGAEVSAGNDVDVQANSSKSIQSAAVAASGGGAANISGAVALGIIGAALDSTSKGSISDENNSTTASSADKQISTDNVSGQLGDSQAVQGMKTTIGSETSSLNVSGSINSTAAGSLDKTQAYIGQSATVHAGGDLNVIAGDLTQINLVATGAAAGFVGIGGAVGVAVTNSTTNAFIDASAQISADQDVTVKATAGNVKADGSKVISTAGAGGVFGLDATVAVLSDTSTTQAYLGSGVDVTKAAALTVEADTTRQSTADAYGLTVAGIAVGASVATATFTGETDAYALGNVTTKVGSMDVKASDSSIATADAIAGTAGIVAGSGAAATAIASSAVNAYLDSGADVTATGDVTVSATGTASTLASAIGVNAGAYSVGVSVAVATTSPDVKAFIGSGSTVTAADLTVSATQALPGNGNSAEADSVGATGGLIGINGTSSTALNQGTTTSYVGDGSTLAISGATSVSATETTSQNASALGIVGGLLAIGADLAIANSSTTTNAYLGNGVAVTGASLSVTATGTDDNFASAVSGTGGVIAGSAAVASTTSDSTTTATTGSGSAQKPINVGSFNLAASHTALFNGQVDSTNAALAGASGAVASNSVDSTVTAAVENGGQIQANSVTISALNQATKDWLPDPSGSSSAGWNISSGSGGAISGPAGISVTHIAQDTSASIGDNANVHVLAPSSGVGVFTMDATNGIIGHDQVQLNSGGVIALAEASSEIYVDHANASVRFGKNTTVVSDLGDIDAGSRAVVDLNTLADADTYGLAGAPAGQAYSYFNGLNTATVGADTLLQANWGNITLAAGESSGGVPTSINAVSTVNLWNKTAIPISTVPDAETTVKNNASLTIDQSSGTITVGSQTIPYGVEAAGDINLAADQGTVTANATGIGKDIYREALAAAASAISELFGGSPVSFDYTGGTTSVTGQGQVTVNGTVLTGIQRDQAVTLSITNFNKDTGTWDLSISSTSGVGTITITPGVSIAGSMETRIANLQALALKYAGTAAADAYNAEITFIEYQMVSLGLASWGTDASGQKTIILGTSGGTGISPYSAAQTLLASFQKQQTSLNSLLGNWTTANTNLSNANTTLSNANTTLSTDNAEVTTIQNSHATYVDRDTELRAWQAATPNSKAANDAQAAVLADEATLNSLGLQFAASPSAAGATPLTASLNDLGTTYPSILTAAQSAAAQALTAQQQATTAQSQAQATFTSIDQQKILAEVDPSGTGATDSLSSQVAALNQQISTLQAELNPADPKDALSQTPNTGPTATFVTLPNITAKLGSIHVKGTSLTGTGNLEAPGNATVTITNKTPDYLVVKDITIDTNQADVTFNNVLVNTNSDINKLNHSGGVANFGAVLTGTNTTPTVTITSSYNPTGTNDVVGTTVIGYAPDIQLTGNISNPRGPVNVTSQAGSILSQGTIDAGTVNVVASNGDFVQSYSSNPDNFFDVGGDPMSINDGTSSPGGIVANGSVFLAARYLNINGLVQSGIAAWNLNLPASGVVLTGSAAQLDVDPNVLTTKIAEYAKGGPAVTTFNNNDGLTVTFDASQNLLTVTEAFAKADYSLASASNPGGLYKLVSNQYGNIGAAYDPANDRYVLDGTQVKGGYIQLYGQVMNTSTSGAATGKLNVMDGYGEINITNATQKAVVLSTLDTGSGAAGVINITDIQFVDDNQKPHSIDTTITRLNGQVTVDQVGAWNAAGTVFNDAAEIRTAGTTSSSSTSSGVDQTSVTGSRSAIYNPQTGLGYVYTTGTDESIEQDYSYSGYRFFGSTSLQTVPNLVDYRVSGPTQLSNPVPLPNGIYLVKNASGSYSSSPTVSDVEVKNGPDVWTTTREYTTTSWWEALFTFGAVTTYHIDFSEVSPYKDVKTTILKADNAIGVNFIGSDTGTINVHSAGSVDLTGAVTNKAGNTTIVAGNSGTGVTSANQNITQDNKTALISAENLTLAASGSIGSATAAVRTVATGTTNASAANGNIAIQQTQGNLTIGTVEASGQANDLLGQVNLEASGDIQGASGGYLVQGNTIQLTSDNGSIGSIAQPLNINVGFSSDATQQPYFGFTGKAQGDIGIQSQKWSGNANGDLLLNTVASSGGDVTVISPGQIIDNNPNQTTNMKTWNELLTYWDSLSLVAGSAANAAQAKKVLQSFENGRTQDYVTYWQMRNLQTNPAVYDPGFQYHSSPAQIAALKAAGITDIQTYDENRTAQYHTLNAEVGTYTTSYVANYKYVATAAEQASLSNGNSWTTQELGISVAPGLLKDITNTNPVVKDPNVSGRNVVLTAGTAIGNTVSTPIVIKTNADASTLTDAQKVALASAEFSDLDLSVPGEIQIYQRKPVNFQALTGLSATVAAAPDGTTDAGNMFLASLGDGILDTIQAQGQVRIKVVGSIVNESASTPALQTGDLVLEAANGGIGYLPDTGSGATVEPLRIQLANGANLTARAADNINLIQNTGDLEVQTIFSRGDLQLTVSHGSILDAFAVPQLNILADTIDLTAAGSIGADGNSLSMGINTITGGITATAGGGAYINGPAGNSFTIDAITAGDAVKLTADVDMTIDGSVTAPGPIGLVTGGTMTMAPGSLIHATASNLQANVGALDMEDNGTQAAAIHVDAGTLAITTLGDAIVTGIVSGNPTAGAVSITAEAGSILPGHAVGSGKPDITAHAAAGAGVTLDADLGIGYDPLDPRALSRKTLAGQDDALNLRTLNLQATSGGRAELADQDSVKVAGITAANDVLLTATGSITGGAIISTSASDPVNITSTAGAIDLDQVSGNSISLTAPGNVSGAGLTGTGTGSRVNVTSTGGDVNVATLSGNVLNLNAAGDLLGTGLAGTGTGSQVNATSTGGLINVSNVTGNALTLTAPGDVTGTTLTASGTGSQVNVRSSAGAVGVSDVTGDSITLNASGKADATGLTGSQIAVDSGSGAVHAAQVTGDAVSLTAMGDVTGDTLTGTTRVSARSTAGAIDLSNVAGNALTLDAAGDVTGTNLTGTGPDSRVSLTSTGGSITASNVTGTVLTLDAAGDVTGTGLIAGTTLNPAFSPSAAFAPAGTTFTPGGPGSQVIVASAGGDISVSDVTGDQVSLSAPGTVTGSSLVVGSNLQLAGTRVRADVTGQNQVVGGSVGGFDGSKANNVQLTLTSPSGFAFSSLASNTATVTVPSGTFSVGSMLIGDRATITNPATFMVVDQFNESMQACDVQLYSGGAPFSFLLTGNKVNTDAYVIYRDPMHEAIATTGEDRGGTEQAEDALNRTTLDPRLSRPMGTPADADASNRTPLISYSGFPVSAEEEEN
ncbi:MAG: hypothetical protein P4L36_22790 [Holophaga sp.]|nr:hypothetical protein [Holophaga sp.]